MSTGNNVEDGAHVDAGPPGLVTTKPVTERLSTKSTTASFSNKQLAGSIKIRRSESFQTASFAAG
jgi:hypothetical protein